MNSQMDWLGYLETIGNCIVFIILTGVNYEKENIYCVGFMYVNDILFV